MAESETRGGQGPLQLGIRLDQVLPFAGYVWRRFAEDRGWRMAAGLSYTSLLAIVPLTAIAFSMLAAFPVFDSVKDQLQSAVFANLLPDSAVAIQDYVDGFVENTAGLSAIGIVALAATTVLLLGTIEADLNSIFRIKRPRALAPRLLVFWAMITLGPLLLGMSFSLSTYFFAATEWLGVDIFTGPLSLVTQSVPTMIVIVMLAVFFFTIPNRPVNALDALIGGLVAGLLFATLRKGFGWYVATFPTYQNIYGALSVVPIFLVWMYLSWTVVLMGAVMTASLGAWRSSGGPPVEGELGAGPRLVAAIRILALLFEKSRSGGKVMRRDLLRQLGISDGTVEGLLERLRDNGFVERTQRGGWVLIRDLAGVTLYDLYQALHLGLRDEDMELAGEGGDGDDGWHERLGSCLRDLKAAQRGATDVSLRELIEGETRLVGSNVAEAPVREAV